MLELLWLRVFFFFLKKKKKKKKKKKASTDIIDTNVSVFFDNISNTNKKRENK